jgi:Flp pilus assembly protein TadD
MKRVLVSCVLLALAGLVLAAPAEAGKGSEKEVKKWKSRIERNPKDATSHYNLGLAYINLERYDEAIEPLQTFTSRKGTDPKGWFFLGRAHQLSGDCESALEPFGKGLELAEAAGEEQKKTAVSCAAQLGDCNLRLERYDAAVTVFRKALRLGAEDRANIMMNIGVAQTRAGNLDDARDSFKSASSREPGNPVIQKNLGVVLREEAFRLLREGSYDQELFVEAARAFGKAAELRSSDGQSLFLAGECYLLADEKAKAREALKGYLDRFPKGKYIPQAKEYLAEAGG